MNKKYTEVGLRLDVPNLEEPIEISFIESTLQLAKTKSATDIKIDNNHGVTSLEFVRNDTKSKASTTPELTQASETTIEDSNGIPLIKPQRMLVWDEDEVAAETRFVICDLGESFRERYLCVSNVNESHFLRGESFNVVSFENAKPIPIKELTIAEAVEKLSQILGEKVIIKTEKE